MAKILKPESDPFEDIFSKLDEIKKKLPNGELSEIKLAIVEISEDQTIIKQKISEINRRLLDPETGLVVKVNKHSESIQINDEEHEILLSQFPLVKNRLDNIEQWQSGINKALWLIFGSILSLIITVLFQFVSKA